MEVGWRVRGVEVILGVGLVTLELDLDLSLGLDRVCTDAGVLLDANEEDETITLGTEKRVARRLVLLENVFSICSIALDERGESRRVFLCGG